MHQVNDDGGRSIAVVVQGGDTGIAGIVATNTTITRDDLTYSQEYVDAIGNGGLSGAPETKMSTEVIRYVHEKSKGAFPIIGVGGIMTPEDAYEKLRKIFPCFVEDTTKYKDVKAVRDYIFYNHIEIL